MSQHPAIIRIESGVHWRPGIHYNTGLELPKFSIDITGWFYVNVKLLIYSTRCHQDSCTNRDSL